MPLHMRLPKRGFNKPNRREYAEVNLGALQRAVESGKLAAGQHHDAASLVAAGVLSHARDGVRLLAKGELAVALHLTLAGASAAAKAAIEAAGGTLTLPTAKDAGEAPPV